MSPRQVFLLSPANCSGQRARLLVSERADFALARRLRTHAGATLGEVFSFLSGLYFRGKLTYARAFATPEPSLTNILTITTNRGLVDADTLIRLDDLRQFGTVPIDATDARYHLPLSRDAAALSAQLAPDDKVILLGSIASDKYVSVLQSTLGQRLLFPLAFVVRGDMSRGGLLLRAVDAGQELEYIPVANAVRRGARPAKLPPRSS